MQKKSVVCRIVVVARAAREEGESKAGVEGNGGCAVSADFQNNFTCSLRARPIEDGAAEGATYAGAAGTGGDDDAFQLGDAVGSGRMQQADREADELAVRLGDEKTALRSVLPPFPHRTRHGWGTRIGGAKDVCVGCGRPVGCEIGGALERQDRVEGREAMAGRRWNC